ncbi:hypothetical protein SAMN05518849_11078 [Sphingobium sp. AP50]|nr:hypothetical protein SAMN05518849_11078 [Sphingobium sp. AP50]
MEFADFPKSPIRTAPYKIHALLTDDDAQFAQFERGSGLIFPGIFGRDTQKNGIEYRLTKALLNLSKDCTS